MAQVSQGSVHLFIDELGLMREAARVGGALCHICRSRRGKEELV